MSWSRTIASTYGAALLLAAAVPLTACGFHPLYGKANPEVVPELAAVKIDSIADRSGQQLRNMLYAKMNPKGEPANPKYVLRTELEENTQALAVQIDEVATRANLLVDATYVMSDLQTGKVLFRQAVRATTSYDIVQNEFANLSAQADAKKRALRQISDEISTQLSFYFARAENGPATAQNQPAPAPQPQALPAADYRPQQYQTAPPPYEGVPYDPSLPPQYQNPPQ